MIFGIDDDFGSSAETIQKNDGREMQTSTSDRIETT